MEDQSVIVVMVAQINEVCNALGCLLVIQLTLDDTAVLHCDFKSGIHINISPS